MSVYASEGNPDPSPVPVGPTPVPVVGIVDGYLGCYTDSSAGRIMVSEASQSDMTATVRGCVEEVVVLYLVFTRRGKNGISLARIYFSRQQTSTRK